MLSNPNRWSVLNYCNPGNTWKVLPKEHARYFFIHKFLFYVLSFQVDVGYSMMMFVQALSDHSFNHSCVPHFNFDLITEPTLKIYRFSRLESSKPR